MVDKRPAAATANTALTPCEQHQQPPSRHYTAAAATAVGRVSSAGASGAVELSVAQQQRPHEALHGEWLC